MAKVLFLGRVFPSICKVTLSLDPSASVQWVDEERNTNYTFKIYVKDGNVSVECDAPHYQHDHLADLYRRAFDLARAAVDVVAFGTGWGLTVVLEKLQIDGGELSDLLPNDPRLPPLVSAFRLNTPPPNNLQETLNLVWTDPAVFFALRDLIEAITLPHRSVVACARAVEGLRTVVAGANVSRPKAWQIFRDALQVDERYLKLITDTSVDSRHGQRARVSGATTTEITIRAWRIMDRFLQYRLRGSRPLTLPEFPLLSG